MQDADRRDWGDRWCGEQWVFTREDGAPLLPQFVTKRFEVAVRRAALPAMTFHGLRHQHASLLIAQGVELAIVSKRLGHSSIAITNDLYSHLLKDANRQAAEAAEALVLQPAGLAAAAAVHTLHTQAARGRGKQKALAEDFLF